MSHLPGAARSPFFIVGFQRSGTTLLRLMLDSHPEVAIPLDTTGLWDRYERKLHEYGSLEDGANRRRLVADLLQEERIQLWEVPLTEDAVLAGWQRPGYAGAVDAFYRCYAAAKGKRLWGDKDPGNMTRLDQLHRWFPESRVIHIIRDGRDACLSLRKQSFGSGDILGCAASWREEVTWVRRMGGLLGGRYFELRYEDLLAEPERVLQDICGFLALPFEASMLEYHRRIGDSIPDSKRHIWPLIDRPPQKENTGKWRKEMSHGLRVCFEKRAGDLLESLGYDVTPRPWSGYYREELRNFLGIGWRAIRSRHRTPG